MPSTESKGKGLSATNLAAYHHYSCDLFLHNTYHGRGKLGARKLEISEMTKAVLQKGKVWESSLLTWLSTENLLHRMDKNEVNGKEIQEIIASDKREHFFISGLSFAPPAEAFEEEFLWQAARPVHFGLSKPDLVEIQRMDNGTVKWQVIDAKASRDVKVSYLRFPSTIFMISKVLQTSHHVQIYFYHLCLQNFLPEPHFSPIGTAGVWISPPLVDGQYHPSLDTMKTISISLLSEPLNRFIFNKLPAIISLPYENVRWHYNPLCRGCPYEGDCRQRAVKEKRLGFLPNISIQDSETLKKVLTAKRRLIPGEAPLADIEDLDRTFHSDLAMQWLHATHPGQLKQARRILALPEYSNKVEIRSPVIDSAVSASTSFSLPTTQPRQQASR